MYRVSLSTIPLWRNEYSGMNKHRLIKIDWPTFGGSERPPAPSLSELERRLQSLRAAMVERRLTHLLVYGDREHFANLMYLTHFDPRFEEALLVVSTDNTPLLIVGNECESYLPVSPLYVASR